MKIRKLLIILGCCIITLLSLCFVGCKRYTAKANIISGDYLLELPMLTTTLDTGSVQDFDIVLPNIYIGEDDIGMYCYYVSSADGVNATYVKAYFNTDIYLLYAYNHINQSDNFTYFGALTDLNYGYSSIVELQNNTLDYILENAVRLDIFVIDGTSRYKFYDSNGIVVGEFLIDNIREVGSIQTTMYSFNILMGEINAANIDIIYNDGYQDGYLKGYNVGVNAGFGATSPFDVVVNSINRFLDIELVGGFKISTFFYISFGMILLGIVIKVFLGG